MCSANKPTLITRSRHFAYTALLSSAFFWASSEARGDKPEQVDGWIEAVAIVRDLGSVEAFFLQTGDYVRIHTGPIAPEILRLWALDPNVEGREVLLAEPGTHRGFLRLVELSGVDRQVEARSAGLFFDTGGIMGLNFRVRDIDLTFRRVQAAGWRPLSEPVRFSVEEFKVAEAIFLGPSGLVIGLIERERPALGPEWRMRPGRLARPNNAFLTTASMPATLAFYEQQMGWQVFLQDQGEAASPGMNLYGWPHNVVATVNREVAWVHPATGGEGSIALISFIDVEGRDFAATAAPPNLGWTALRTWTAKPPNSKANTVSSPTLLAPYGCVRIEVHTDPGAVRLEQLQIAAGCGNSTAVASSPNWAHNQVLKSMH